MTQICFTADITCLQMLCIIIKLLLLLLLLLLILLLLLLLLIRYTPNGCIGVQSMMASMQTQWTWLHQLTNCMDVHMKHVSQHQQVSSLGV